MADLAKMEGIKELLAESEFSAMQPQQESRLEALVPIATSLIETSTDRTWGTIPTPHETIVLTYDGFGELWLPKRVFAVDVIAFSPTWDGSLWTGGTTLVANTYRLTHPDALGAYRAVQNLTDRWRGTYRIQGIWDDTVDEAPADLVYAANYIVAEIYKKQQSDPSGVTGPEGLITSGRNALREPEIAMILNKYRRDAVGQVLV